MPTGRTGPERERALKSHGHCYNDDCKLSCYYHNHPLSTSLHTALAENSTNSKSDSGGPENAPKYAFWAKIKIVWGGGTDLSPMGRETPPLHTPPPLGACDASIHAPSALDLTPKPKSWIRPHRTVDTNRPDAAPMHLTVKPTKYCDGRPIDGQRLRILCE